MLQTAMSEMGCGSFVRCITVRLAVLLRLNVFVVAALFVVAPSTAMAAANCGEKNERACCLKERDIKGVGGLNDCEKNLYQVPGCDPKERNCGCSNSVFNSAGVCRSPQWIVEHSKQVSAKMLADAKKVVAEIEAEAKKASAETKRIAEEAACKASVAALSIGKLPPGVSAPSPRPSQPNPEVAMKVTVDFLKANKMLGPNNEVIDNPLVTELMRLRKNANNAKAEVKKLFSPEVMCSEANLKKHLQSMFANHKPVYSGHFFMAYSLTASAGAGLGFQTGFVVATDYRGEVGVYAVLGPQIIFNASIGDSIGVQFFPVTKLADFSGWGYGIGASGGPPTKVFSGGMDLSFDSNMKPMGFGPNAGIGLGALPVDVNVSWTYAIKLWSTSD